ncbi:MAG: biotin/lipoyl-binding protein, partial [Bacteroides sp.]|nr:biotin/lipoyl-binding protein [Bacteroides sp.]
MQKDKIELRSEEFQEVLGDPPHWLIKWSIMLSGIFVLIMLIGSIIFRYPEIIPAEMTLTSLAPVTSVVSRNSGRLQELRVSEGQWVNAGEYLAIIENTASTEDIILLKTYLSNDITQDEEIVLPPESLHLGEMQSLYSSFYIVLREHNDFLKLSYYP